MRSVESAESGTSQDLQTHTSMEISRVRLGNKTLRLWPLRFRRPVRVLLDFIDTAPSHLAHEHMQPNETTGPIELTVCSSIHHLRDVLLDESPGLTSRAITLPYMSIFLYLSRNQTPNSSPPSPATVHLDQTVHPISLQIPITS
jgi:hypothetical protein